MAYPRTLDAGEDLNGNGTLETYGANLPYQPWAQRAQTCNTTTIVRSRHWWQWIFPDCGRDAAGIDVGSVANMSRTVTTGLGTRS